jgi:uncharacterized SAM-dependent methyltransferase
MYQNYQQNAFQNQMGSSGGSQYRGLETKYQPIGNVQSQYNQSLGMSGQSSYQNANQNQYQNQNASFQGQNTTGFHTANYRGNQQGHDAYLRSDSTQTAQSQYGMGSGNQTSSFNNTGSSYGYPQQFTQQSPESFHTASYQGSQPGHDTYLRSDSTQPSQSQFGFGASAGFNSSSAGMNSQYGSNQQNQANQQNQQYNQFQNPQSFHASSYRGNQAGHDAYLRSDSTQPSQSTQSQFGSTNNNSFTRYQF